MSVWQRLNAPRNKRENRVAKIARDQERERIIKLLEAEKEGLLKIALSSDNPELLEQAKIAHTGISLAIGVITGENE